MEMWKTVPGYEGILEASEDGSVRLLPTVRTAPNGLQQRRAGCIYSPFVGNNGYAHIAPKFGTERKKLLVHRLIAMTFVAGNFKDATVNHINGNKLDNRAENLEWITKSQNTKHAWENNLVPLIGEDNPTSKLTAKQVSYVKKLLAMNAPISTIAGAMNVSVRLIGKIRDGKAWARVECAR